MSNIEIKTGQVYLLTENAFKQNINTVIHNGGTGAGKTFDIMIKIILMCLSTPNKVFTVVSESYPHLQIGTMRYAAEILKMLQYGAIFNKSSSKYYFNNGAVLEFFSADRIEKALGARRYLLYGNEINSLRLEVWEELARRSKYIIADFNPTSQFWLERWLQYEEQYKIIKSNYLDNPFLPDHEKSRIERRAAMDNNFKRVHIYCEYGFAEDLVFNQQNIILIDEFPKDIKFTYGLDFGFVAPTALVKASLIDNAVYIDELMYQSGLNTMQLIEKVKALTDGSRINADSEDSRMIAELFGKGINVYPAVKKSVVEGISFLQGCKIHITKRSLNAIKEFRQLTNEKNKAGIFTGRFLGEDHCVDATRYSIETQKNAVKAPTATKHGWHIDTPYEQRYGKLI